jgi:hypothetical protein
MIAVTQHRAKLRHWFILGLAAITVEAVIIMFFMGGRTSPLWKKHWLSDPNPAVRAYAIRSFHLDDRVLLNALQDDDPDVRLLATARFGSNRIETFIQLLNDENPSVRREAAWKISYFGPTSWPILRGVLNEGNSRERAGVALALRDAFRNRSDYRCWPSNEKKEIIPILRNLLNDEDQEVRRNVERTLEVIDDRERKDRP